MSTVLAIALVALAFLAMLKIGDTFRDLTFEIRQTRFAIENQTRRIEDLHGEWWAWTHLSAAQRGEEARRKINPTLDELMEDTG